MQQTLSKCLWNELPSLCTFPQPGTFLSSLSIWLTVNCEGFSQAMSLTTLLLAWEGLGVSVAALLLLWYQVCIHHLSPKLYSCLFSSPACGLLWAKRGCGCHWLSRAQYNAWTLSNEWTYPHTIKCNCRRDQNILRGD